MQDVVHIAEDSMELRDARLREHGSPSKQARQNPHQVAFRGPSFADPGITEAEITPVAQPDFACDHDRNSLIPARGVAYALLFGSALWALMVLLWRLV